MKGLFKRPKTARKSGRRSGRRRALIGIDRWIGLLLLVTAVVVHFWNPAPVEILQVKLFDAYQRLKPRPIPETRFKPVTIIDLDEGSLSEYGQWPWPRTLIAELVQKTMSQGAVLVAFDMVFAEPDRMSPKDIVKNVIGLDQETSDRLAHLPSNDLVFADVIKRGRVVLGQAGYRLKQRKHTTAPIGTSVAIRGPDPTPYMPEFPELVRNIDTIEQAAAGRGIFSLQPERDGIVRRVQALFRHEGKLYPTLTVEMLRAAFGNRTIVAFSNEAGMTEIGVASARQFPPKGLKIPTDRRGRIWPYFSESDEAKYVPARDILNGSVDPALLKGKLTILGTSAVGLLDVRSTPVSEIIPGVEVHAQIIEAAFTNSFLLRPNTIELFEYLLMIGVGLLMIWLVPRASAHWTALLFLVIAGAAMGTSWYLFAEQRTLFDVGYSVITILLLYTLLIYLGYAKEENERRQVRNAFSHYLSPAMVEKLAEDPDQLALGGENREMTMLFCDVRGFTTISEQYDASGLTQLINRLLTPLTQVILNCQGTVDKYMGDCIMAFWNAPLDDPDHARNACVAALEMQRQMVPLNDSLAVDAEREGRVFMPFRIGVGLNTGDAVVGNMGSEQRFDYSVLGDNVNLASRLEGQCKTYGTDILVGENTQAAAPDMAFLELDLVRLKGKTEANAVHTLLGDAEEARGDGFRQLAAAHAQMLAAYRARDWATARAKVVEARSKQNGYNLDAYYDLMMERIEDFEAEPPPPDWDGVYVAETK
ncbi:MAG: adenylate/guanylate cyclase domain-containing protein [Hyphomicrobiales bacterium]|nr:adenylate/guanylate cyclase domain-containing protein [Hyphomicrobiales bacterium]